MPPAAVAFERIIQQMEGTANRPPEGSRFGGLARAVFALNLRHLAWAGPEELGTEMALRDSGGDDEFINALAEYLWENRRPENPESVT